MWPLTPPLASVLVTEGWGHARDGRLHGGCDMRAPVGTAAFAAAGGSVIFGGEYADGSGGAVELDHGNGMVSRYLHLSRVDVKRGAELAAGEQLGATGFAKSPHLHFDCWLHPDKLALYTAKFGTPKGLGDSKKTWSGVAYVKVPSEPLVVGASYQDDVAEKAREFGVRLYSPQLYLPTLVDAGVLLALLGVGYLITHGIA